MIHRITIDVECPLPDRVHYEVMNYDDNDGSFIKLEARWLETADVRIVSLNVGEL